jgi:hypothetical protein
MGKWEHLPYETRLSIIGGIVQQSMREWESSRNQLSPTKIFAEFRSLLLVCQDIHNLANRACHIHIPGVKSGCFFQIKQHEIVSTLARYAQETWLGTPTKGFDHRIIERLAGRYIRNPLIYGDRDLMDRLFGCFHPSVTACLLVQMPEFLESNAAIDLDTPNYRVELEFNDYNSLWATATIRGSRMIQLPTLDVLKIDSCELQRHGDDIGIDLSALQKKLGNGWLLDGFYDDGGYLDSQCYIISTETLLVQEVCSDDTFLKEGREAIDESLRETYEWTIEEKEVWDQVASRRLGRASVY